MKVTYTSIVARKLLLAFLSFIIILVIAALFVRSSISSSLESISKLSNNTQIEQSQAEQALMLLHQSEDDFQASLVSADSIKYTNYKVKLNQAFNKIDTLLKEKSDTTNLTAEQRMRVRFWYQKKLALSNKLYLFKHNFDSLLTNYAKLNKAVGASTDALNKNLHHIKTNLKDKSDTIRNKTKKGLLGRLKDAIANKDNGNSVVIKHTKNIKQTDVITNNASGKKLSLNKKLQQLQQSNVSLLNMQRDLAILNTRIIDEIDDIINDIRDTNYKMVNDFKSMALKSYQENTALLNKFYLIALFLLLAFTGLLIAFVIKLNESELQLRKEIERSVAIAQQKMDLLHHMSHEVRNPLTAIKGFLYIFGKTDLSEKQKKMLESITVSSEMMLTTLNDTLDAAKMENSELKLNSEPFNPDNSLKTIVESMSFSASKKELSLDYHFTGNADAIVYGDSFRLKQIMVNLLSNAIKYTEKGGITVNAQLNATDNKLQIDVIDTGVGISAEQQASLFSKYYQTSSAKGQIGTGLGLFICRELIKIQGGKITVKSAPDKGTTFSFYIPYAKSRGVKQA